MSRPRTSTKCTESKFIDRIKLKPFGSVFGVNLGCNKSGADSPVLFSSPDVSVPLWYNNVEKADGNTADYRLRGLIQYSGKGNGVLTSGETPAGAHYITYILLNRHTGKFGYEQESDLAWFQFDD